MDPKFDYLIEIPSRCRAGIFYAWDTLPTLSAARRERRLCAHKLNRKVATVRIRRVPRS